MYVKIKNKKERILVIIPKISHRGGVNNLFKLLDLNSEGNIDYFILHNHSIKENVFQLFKRLFIKYFNYAMSVLLLGSIITFYL